VLAEVDLAEDQARGEHRLHGPVGPRDAVAGQHRLRRLDRPAVGAQGKCLGHGGGAGLDHDEHAVVALAVARQVHRVRDDAPADGLHVRSGHALGGRAAVVLGHGAQHGAGQPLPGRPVGDGAGVEGQHLPARGLDALHELGLDLERPDEAIEVRAHDDVGLAALDHLDGGAQAPALGQRGAAGHVQFLEHFDQREAARLGGGDQGLALFGGAGAVVAAAG
jgi:hypothetical protein